jgi:hypothetical protein
MRPLALIALLFVAGTAYAADSCLAIIGTGNVGSALGARYSALGHPVVYGTRSPQSGLVRELVRTSGGKATAATPGEAAGRCATVFFAVPREAAEASLRSLGNLDGKLLIDVTNPLKVQGGREIALPVTNSAAELVQQWAPGARVVKALNTVNYVVMANPGIAGGPVSVPLSGDDAAAKAAVADLVRALGLEPIDVGPLRTARYTENMALLYVSQFVGGRQGFDYHLRPRVSPSR